MAGKPKNRTDKNSITQKQFDDICASIAESTNNIQEQCKFFGISTASFYRMIATSPENEKKYARAKEVQDNPLFDSYLKVANEPVPMAEHGLDSAAVADKRVRLDALKWYLSKLKPRKYGDSVDITTQGDKINDAPVYNFDGMSLDKQREIRDALRAARQS